YYVDKTLSIRTTEVCPWTGVWYPAVGLDRHSLVFGIKGLPMPAAFYCDKTMDKLAAKNGKAYSDDIETTAVETIWHPVKLAEPANNPESVVQLIRCDGGQPCPREGYWWTPAKPGAGRAFKKGEIMPSYQSEYGVTIWQWSPD